MKLSSILLLPILIKSLIIANPVTEQSTDINDEYISCYQCQNYYDLDSGPKNITHKQIDSDSCKQNFIVKGKKGDYACQLTITPLYLTQKALINQSLVKKVACSRAWKGKSSNVYCDDSKLCRYVSICCDEDFCNSYENFGLTKVFNKQQNNGTIENYNKYANISCEIKDNRRSDYCIAITNKDIYDYTIGKNIPSPSPKLETQPTTSKNTDDNDDSENNQQAFIVKGEQALEPSKKLLIKIKVWLQTIEDNNKNKNDENE